MSLLSNLRNSKGIRALLLCLLLFTLLMLPLVATGCSHHSGLSPDNSNTTDDDDEPAGGTDASDGTSMSFEFSSTNYIC